MEPSKIIGQNIMTCREISGIKQEMLAKHLGISKGRMSQIENGECRELTINRLQCIASYIGTDFFTLLSPPAWITQRNRWVKKH